MAQTYWFSYLIILAAVQITFKTGHLKEEVNLIIKKYPRYVSFGYGKEWDKHDFKLFEIWKTNLGWTFNAWRFWISYDNYNNTQKNR